MTRALEQANRRYENAMQWVGKDNPSYGPIINRDTCIAKNGCRNCIEFCPGDLIHFDGTKPVVKYLDECWFCGVCATVCGPRAISYIFPEKVLKGKGDEGVTASISSSGSETTTVQ